MLVARLVSLGVLIVLSGIAMSAPADDLTREDLSTCTGSEPEPAQSGNWKVAFCNRTGHDIVVEFRDNDCPAQGWGRRGDVYRRSLRRGESATVSLCYANERPGAALAPGIPMVRIPGGKGVVTSWRVVGDCGEHSDQLYLDARSFYDRGDYKNGIVLLQYPVSAPHCIGGAAAAAAPSGSPQAPAVTNAPNPPTAHTSTAPSATPPVPSTPSPAETPPAAANQTPTGAPPQLYVKVDSGVLIPRSVQVYATNGSGEPNYRCSFVLTLGFSDGASYVERVKSVDVTSGLHDASILTKKYLKTVVKADMTTPKCTAQ